MSKSVFCLSGIFERVGAHEISYSEEKSVPKQEESRV